MQIPIPTQKGKDDIYNYGFRKSITRELFKTSSSTVYDVSEPVNTGSIQEGGNLNVKNLTIAGISKMVAPGDDLQAALDQLHKSGGGQLLLKPGTYTVTSNLRSYTDIAIIGSNPGNTTLEFQGDARLIFAGTKVYTTGTIASFSGNFLSGTGTAWLSNITPDHQIFVGSRWYQIAAVVSDTLIVTAEDYADTLTFPGVAYRAAIPVIGIHIAELTIQGSTSASGMLDFDDCRFARFDRVILALGNVGIDFDHCSEIATNTLISIANSGHGIKWNNSGLLAIESTISSSNGGSGWVFNNVYPLSIAAVVADGNSEDGFNFTDVKNAYCVTEAGFNTRHGYQFVSGCSGMTFISCNALSNGSAGIVSTTGNNDIVLTGSQLVNNTGDGIKLAASSNRWILNATTFKGNGSYGVNVAASTCGSVLIGMNVFYQNTTGGVNNLGTNTLIRSNQGATDYP